MVCKENSLHNIKVLLIWLGILLEINEMFRLGNTYCPAIPSHMLESSEQQIQLAPDAKWPPNKVLMFRPDQPKWHLTGWSHSEPVGYITNTV